MEAHSIRDEWKKLVCAVFTGVELSDGNGGLLVRGQIREILESNHNYIPKEVIRSLFSILATCDSFVPN